MKYSEIRINIQIQNIKSSTGHRVAKELEGGKTKSERKLFNIISNELTMLASIWSTGGFQLKELQLEKTSHPLLFENVEQLTLLVSDDKLCVVDSHLKPIKGQF